MEDSNNSTMKNPGWNKWLRRSLIGIAGLAGAFTCVTNMNCGNSMEKIISGTNIARRMPYNWYIFSEGVYFKTDTEKETTRVYLRFNLRGVSIDGYRNKKTHRNGSTILEPTEVLCHDRKDFY